MDNPSPLRVFRLNRWKFQSNSSYHVGILYLEFEIQIQAPKTYEGNHPHRRLCISRIEYTFGHATRGAIDHARSPVHEETSGSSFAIPPGVLSHRPAGIYSSGAV